MKRIIWMVLLINFLWIVVSCSQPPAGELESDWIIPPAGETTGIVQGVLLNASNGKPVMGIPYLSRNLSNKDPEMPATISFSLQKDPRAVINTETGEFYFKDIEPADNYVIVLHYGPGELIVLTDDNTQYPIMIEVGPGEVNDLGKILAEEP